MKSLTKTDIKMKTSNKLIIGLIFIVFLFITAFVGVLKYHQVPMPFEFKIEHSESSSFNQTEPNSASLVYFPVALILPLMRK